MAERWLTAGPAVRLLGGRWTLAVLHGLVAGGRRYQDLHAALPGISHKVLTDTLRRAERDGLIARQVDRTRTGTATLYQLTELAGSLDEPLAALGGWVDRRWSEVDAARASWDERTDDDG